MAIQQVSSVGVDVECSELLLASSQNITLLYMYCSSEEVSAAGEWQQNKNEDENRIKAEFTWRDASTQNLESSKQQLSWSFGSELPAQADKEPLQ